jgi:transcriptional regulator with XRE-family HTH domain
MAKSIFTREHRRFIGGLRDARKSAGLTQIQLSEKLGKNQSYISNIERGQRRIDVVEFIKVAEALSIDPKLLFGDLLVRIKSDR